VCTTASPCPTALDGVAERLAGPLGHEPGNGGDPGAYRQLRRRREGVGQLAAPDGVANVDVDVDHPRKDVQACSVDHLLVAARRQRPDLGDRLAGHPDIGSAWAILGPQRAPVHQNRLLGPVPVTRSPVPHVQNRSHSAFARSRARAAISASSRSSSILPSAISTFPPTIVASTLACDRPNTRWPRTVVSSNGVGGS